MIQQATEPRTPTNPAGAPPRRVPINKAIVESLVIPLAMVVIDECLEGPAKVTLGERDPMSVDPVMGHYGAGLPPLLKVRRVRRSATRGGGRYGRAAIKRWYRASARNAVSSGSLAISLTE